MGGTGCRGSDAPDMLMALLVVVLLTDRGSVVVGLPRTASSQVPLSISREACGRPAVRVGYKFRGDAVDESEAAGVLVRACGHPSLRGAVTRGNRPSFATPTTTG